MTLPSQFINNNSSQVVTVSDNEFISATNQPPLSALTASFDVSNSYGVPWLLNAIRGKPLVVSLVGLPGRGKTIIATKLKRFLLWNKICCEVFHLSNYRRLISPVFPEHITTEPLKTSEEELRKQCFHMLFEDVDTFFAEGTKPFSVKAAMNDSNANGSAKPMEDVPYLQHVRGNVAIFDFANTQRSHRRELMDFCSSQDYDLFFIETITYERSLIQLYINGIELSNPDYLNLSKEEALVKFDSHFKDYYDTYQSLDDESEEDIAFLKIFDGGSRCLVHNMNGYMQSKMVYYLMSLHFARQPIYITRHGESLNNTLGIIGGDSELTSRGFKYADAFADYINSLPELRRSSSNKASGGQPGVQVWASTLKRTQQTAARVHAPVLCWNALSELDAGQFDGKSCEFIEKNHPQEAQNRRDDKFRYRYPDGESYDDLVTRLEPVIMELERTRSTIVIVCHQAVMRCLMAYLLDRDFDELPYLDVPLHHLFKVTPHACGYEVEDIEFKIPSNEYKRPNERKTSSFTGAPKPNSYH